MEIVPNKALSLSLSLSRGAAPVAPRMGSYNHDDIVVFITVGPMKKL